MDKLPEELILRQLIDLPEKDRQTFSKLNKRNRRIYEENKDYIYMQVIKRELKLNNLRSIYRTLIASRDALDEHDVSLKRWYSF